MKKFGMIMAAVAAAFMASCNSSAPQGELKDEADTLCYAIGMQQSNGIEGYMQQMELDSTLMDELLRGFVDGANLGGDAKKKAYYAGVSVGFQIGSQAPQGLTQQIYGPNDSINKANFADFVAGFVAAAKGNAKLDKNGVDSLSQAIMTKINNRRMEKEYGAYKKENEAFMAKVAKQEGVKALSDGIYYKVEKEGNGNKPAATDKVKIHYEGKLINDTVFDSSYKRNQPAEMPLAQVMPGFRTALTNMPVGSKWVIYIPQEQAYGSQDMGQIKPFSALVFTVELIDILKDAAPKADNLPEAEIVPAK